MILTETQAGVKLSRAFGVIQRHDTQAGRYAVLSEHNTLGRASQMLKWRSHNGQGRLHIATREPKPIIHTVSGRNFHGAYRICLRGPAEGFELSEAQARKVREALCGTSGCECGGGYGDGPDLTSARIVETWGDGALRLIPAGADVSPDLWSGDEGRVHA